MMRKFEKNQYNPELNSENDGPIRFTTEPEALRTHGLETRSNKYTKNFGKKQNPIETPYERACKAIVEIDPHEDAMRIIHR